VLCGLAEPGAACRSFEAVGPRSPSCRPLWQRGSLPAPAHACLRAPPARQAAARPRAGAWAHVPPAAPGRPGLESVPAALRISGCGVEAGAPWRAVQALTPDATQLAPGAAWAPAPFRCARPRRAPARAREPCAQRSSSAARHSSCLGASATTGPARASGRGLMREQRSLSAKPCVVPALSRAPSGSAAPGAAWAGARARRGARAWSSPGRATSPTCACSPSTSSARPPTAPPGAAAGPGGRRRPAVPAASSKASVCWRPCECRPILACLRAPAMQRRSQQCRRLDLHLGSR